MIKCVHKNCNDEKQEFFDNVLYGYSDLNKHNLSNDQYYYLKQWHKIYSMVLNEYKNLKNLIFIDNSTLVHKPNILNNLLNNLDLDKNINLNNAQFSKKNKYDLNLDKNKDLYELYDQLKFLEQKTLFNNE